MTLSFSKFSPFYLAIYRSFLNFAPNIKKGNNNAVKIARQIASYRVAEA